VASVNQVPKPNNIISDIENRLRALETNLARNLIIGAAGVHVPGKLTVGDGPQDGSGGTGLPIITGEPSPPTGLTLTTGADATNVWVNAAWTFPDGSAAPVAMFEVRWKRASDTEYQFATTTDSSNYRINGLDSATSYNVGVRSISTMNEVSTWVVGTITSGTDSTAPAKVTGLVVAVGPTSQMGTWNDNTEADLDHYRVQVDNNSNFSSPVVDKITYATVTTVDGLANNTRFYWRVAAVDRAGNQGPWSNSANNSTILIPSAYISSLTADKITAGTIGVQVIKLSNSAGSRIESFDGTSMVIRGDGSANFGNVTITGGTLTVGSGSTIFKVDSAGNHWSGNAAFGSAPFQVSNAGALTATNANITGTFQTGTASDYIVATAGSNVLNFYDDNDRVGTIKYDSATYFNFEIFGSDGTNNTIDGLLALGNGYAVLTPGYNHQLNLGSLDGGPTNRAANVVITAGTATYIGQSGGDIAKFDRPSSIGRLKMLSGATNDGGQVVLDHPTAGTVEAQFSNTHSTSFGEYIQLAGDYANGVLLRVKLTGGTSTGPALYNNSVGATRKQLYVDNNGFIGVA